MSDLELCDVCGLPDKDIKAGMCPFCRSLTRPKDDDLVVHIVDEMGFAECDGCGAALDRQGFCGRCLDPLNEWLERMMR